MSGLGSKHPFPTPREQAGLLTLIAASKSSRPFLGQSWSRRRARANLILTLSFWLLNYAILVFRKILEGNDIRDAALVRLVLTIFGSGLCYIIHATLKLIAPKTFPKRAIAVALLALFAAETYAWASYYVFAAIDPSKNSADTNWSIAIYTVAFWTWFFLAWAGLYVALEYSFTVAEAQEQSLALQADAYAARLQALHNQIRPHFLFNCLNSISALILDGRPAEAERMIAELSDFFRKRLALDPYEDIPLVQEIELQRGYLAIEQLRYPDLEIDIDLPKGLEAAAVPILILQPIIENAVKYGVQSSPPPARIQLIARARARFLIIEIKDSGCVADTAPRTGTGMGLRNVQERLFQRYGDRQNLIAERTIDGFAVTIMMPLERHH
jgi:hypothetical protein